SIVRGIANSKIGFGDLILLLRYFFKLKVSTHPILFNSNKNCLINKLATLYLLSLSLYLIDFLIFLKTEL
ncbi:hypothetical protein NYY69_09575, partial [Acinetobacter baumannii]|nr:hypothetical protein [Acinetobacter baumannii]